MSHDIAKANTPSPAASNSHGSQSAAPGMTDRSRARPVPTAAIAPAATVIGTRKRRQCSQAAIAATPAATAKRRAAAGLCPESDSRADRSEEHTSELQSLMRISYAVFCLKKQTEKIK